MSRPIQILAISSSVAAGHVGLTAIVPTLNFCGIEAAALPTTILSNHPGLVHFAGTQMSLETLREMMEAYARNGWLAGFTTVLTGYLPSAAHVAFARMAVERVRESNPDARYICDPVLGDDPKGVYIQPAAADAIRNELIPLADIVLPNRFELAWLTGRQVGTPEDAIIAARLLLAPRVVAKSIPAGPDKLANLDITPHSVEVCTSPRLDGVPKGTGDMFSALIAAGWTTARATEALEVTAKASLGADHLQIVGNAPHWLRTSSATQDTTRRIENPSRWIAGVDGCPAGWIMVAHDIDRPDQAISNVFGSFAELLAFARDFAAIAVDMPIGLPDRSSIGGRAADRAARAVLGARQSSVFAVPARAAVACTDYREACGIALLSSDPPRKVSRQAFNLFPKIREVDALMTPELQKRVIECHPEVAFWAMNGKQPLSEPKKVKSRPYGLGLDLRRKLLEAHGFASNFIDSRPYPARTAAPDDFLDACAAAWTARRLARSQAERIPAEPDRDGRGLRMEIVY